MDSLIINILRGSVSCLMYVILLFTLAQTKLSRNSTVAVAVVVFVANILTSLWFYLHGDLTSLSRFTVVLFIVITLAMKPLMKISFMRWCFTFLTTFNIAMMIIILSFHLSRFFPLPQYVHTLFRFGLYLGVILLFRRFLLPLYRSMVDNWPVFSILVVVIFLNLSYFFLVTNDIHTTLITFRWPQLLLVLLSAATYGTVFYFLKKFAAMHELEVENLKIQRETGRLHAVRLQLEQYANYDMLTGLPNRRCFFEQLGRTVSACESSGNIFVLFYIDLDGFKDINDTAGHQIGDEILKVVGTRLLHAIRETDFVARLGGDEFAVIVHAIDDMSTAQEMAERMHQRLREVILLDTVAYTIDSCIGIASYPDSGRDGETLVRNADSAMYEIKRKGKGGIGSFMTGQQTSGL
jgi:diguanylate cyclase (GGDEF)-like protein